MNKKKVAIMGALAQMQMSASKPTPTKPDIIIIGDENDEKIKTQVEALKKAYPGKTIGFSDQIPEDRNFDLGKAFGDINKKVELVTREPEPIVSKYREKLKRKYLAQEARKNK